MNINVNVSKEVEQIFDFINNAGQTKAKCDNIGQCSYALFEKNLEESGEDVQIQYNYLVRLIAEMEELEEEVNKELNETLIDHEVAIVLDDDASRDEAQYKIDKLSAKLDDIEERLRALSEVYDDLVEEVMF